MMAVHRDGSIVIYDKEREDSNFQQERTQEDVGMASSNKDGTDTPKMAPFRVERSIHGFNRAQKQNPVASWSVSKAAITAFAFSPDAKYIAVVAEDGFLRIIDFAREKMVDAFSSYYGGLLCVSWSPDGRYILTGGQDDLVSIWSTSTRSLVARCQGHQSFVRSVAFDPWSCDERVYRFGSVGEDCRLLFWDFSVKSLHRPKASTHRSSISSYGNGSSVRSAVSGTTRRDSGASGPPGSGLTGSRIGNGFARLDRTRSRSDSSAIATDDDEEVYHPIASKASIPIIPPVMVSY